MKFQNRTDKTIREQEEKGREVVLDGIRKPYDIWTKNNNLRKGFTLLKGKPSAIYLDGVKQHGMNFTDNDYFFVKNNKDEKS